jgi:hypothetical protein
MPGYRPHDREGRHTFQRERLPFLGQMLRPSGIMLTLAPRHGGQSGTPSA